MSAAAPSEIMTKSDFAAHISRHPAFVTRAIEQGKLAGAALVGEGRGTRINVAEALRQLRVKLDLGQQLAQAQPILGLASPSGGAVSRGAAPEDAVERPADTSPQVSAGDDPLAEHRAENVRLRNAKMRADIERGAREDAVAAGQLVDAVAVSRALARQLAPLVNTFDELPAAISKPISEEFNLPYTQVLIAVKRALRRSQTAWAERALAVGRVAAAPVAG